MNKDTAKDYLPLVVALSEGRVIQRRSNVNLMFTDEAEVDFTLPADCYRIKPEPREWWLTLDENGELYAITINRQKVCSGELSTIHVREVLT